nr:hydantoinase/oxoprolinase family protein [Candidatus Njordarchaeum guaymaensis]
MKNRVIIGWDIGGANIKASIVEFSGGKIVKIRSALRYLPIWLEGKDKLPEVLARIKEELVKGERISGVAVTMTAELSDAYYTKREGVNHVLDGLLKVFPDENYLIRVVDVEAKLRTVEEARAEPLMVAAANWSATAWLVAQHFRDTILIDAGSTTIDIIPIKAGKIMAVGKTDPDRLVSGELVFTGALRTPIPAITSTLTYHGKPCRISSEKFALSADIHLVLGHITEEEYTCETADGRAKNWKDSLARIARVICADVEMLKESEIIGLAKQIYDEQLKAIGNSISQVMKRLHVTRPQMREYLITTAGLGRKFLAAKAAMRTGFKKIVDLEDVLGQQGAVTAPSAAAAVMLNNHLLSQEERSRE